MTVRGAARIDMADLIEYASSDGLSQWSVEIADALHGRDRNESRVLREWVERQECECDDEWRCTRCGVLQNAVNPHGFLVWKARA